MDVMVRVRETTTLKRVSEWVVKSQTQCLIFKEQQAQQVNAI